MPATQAVLKGRFSDGSETRNIFTFADIADESGPVASITGYLNALFIALAPALGAGWAGYSVEIIHVNGTGSTPFTEFPFVVAGSSGGEILPHTDAYLMIGKTGVKRTQGKKYFAGIPESMQVGGVISSTAIGYLESAASVYIARFGSGLDAVIPGVYSKAHDVFNEFTGARITNIVAMQQRRKQGRGI